MGDRGGEAEGRGCVCVDTVISTGTPLSQPLPSATLSLSSSFQFLPSVLPNHIFAHLRYLQPALGRAFQCWTGRR